MKRRRGQYFTSNAKVQRMMLSLLRTGHDGRILEPSAGRGDLVRALMDAGYEHVHAVEIDDGIKPIIPADRMIFGSFFEDGTGGYDAVFGNPPYVQLKNVPAADRAGLDGLLSRYSSKVNLYMLFMDSCMDRLKNGGEMVLIIPKEWMFSTAAAPLRDRMAYLGAITDIVDCTDERVFDDAAPTTTMIIRWERGAVQETIRHAGSLSAGLSSSWDEYGLEVFGGRWIIGPESLVSRLSGFGRLGAWWDAKVGMVSGMDSVYRVSLSDPDYEALASSPHVHEYVTTRGVELFLDPYGVESFGDLSDPERERLLSHEEELRGRSIRRFTDDDWWQWGAVRNHAQMVSPGSGRFLCYGRTRLSMPFMLPPAGVGRYSGGIMGMYGHADRPQWMTARAAVEYLNSGFARRVFAAMGLMTGDRVTFQPATISDIPFPATPSAAAAALAG